MPTLQREEGSDRIGVNGKTTDTGDVLRSDENLATDQWREEGPWLVLLLLPLVACTPTPPRPAPARSKAP